MRADADALHSFVRRDNQHVDGSARGFRRMIDIADPPTPVVMGEQTAISGYLHDAPLRP
jgi:hypothetical protein